MLFCYLWARARYINYPHEYIAILTGFVLDVLSYGLFDYFIIVEIPIYLLLLPPLITGLRILTGQILNNCLDFSTRSALIHTSLTGR